MLLAVARHKRTPCIYATDDLCTQFDSRKFGTNPPYLLSFAVTVVLSALVAMCVIRGALTVHSLRPEGAGGSACSERRITLRYARLVDSDEKKRGVGLPAQEQHWGTRHILAAWGCNTSPTPAPDLVSVVWGPPRARITALHGNNSSRYDRPISRRISWESQGRCSRTETGDDRHHHSWRVEGKTPLKLVSGATRMEDVIACSMSLQRPYLSYRFHACCK